MNRPFNEAPAGRPPSVACKAPQMSFLDRFKPQPKWKHADPAIRAAAIPDIPGDDEHRAVLEELAATDDDVRVRRAAADRVSDVEALVRLALAEPDAALQRDLAERLVTLACEPAVDDAAAARALEGVRDEKQCAAIAKASPHDTVRTAALARVHDAKLLGSVGRHAADGQTALEAVHRLADPGELLNVALKTEHKDAGVAALERAIDASTEAGVRGGRRGQETLEGVVNRAKGKAVAKRARGMLQAMDEAEAARRQALERGSSASRPSWRAWRRSPPRRRPRTRRRSSPRRRTPGGR
jgi:hypothetical protein